jgi:undecaprenyl diphosphate synthase
MFFKRKPSVNEKNTLEQIDRSNIPAHIAIIMDGNGRWAKKRGLPRSIGHKAGVETIRDIVKASSSLGIKYLTLYAFSTENWTRPNEEVNILMKLLLEYLKKEIKELHMNNVIVRTIGDTTHLPKECIEELNNAYELTKTNDGLTLNLALNYGGRDEIKRAIIDIANEVKLGKIKVEDINEVLISDKLDTNYMPDPDLIIRPSGEYRVSNFLLWQLAYSEFWYSNIYWPDFKREHLYNAILDYQKRNRRFGGVQQG